MPIAAPMTIANTAGLMEWWSMVGARLRAIRVKAFTGFIRVAFIPAV